jgi:hypothetical protein
VSADPRTLATLEAEAKRRGVSLTIVMAEALDAKAAALRTARRPHLGVARSRDGLSAAELTGEPVAHPLSTLELVP